jgi:hypothetical protein
MEGGACGSGSGDAGGVAIRRVARASREGLGSSARAAVPGAANAPTRPAAHDSIHAPAGPNPSADNARMLVKIPRVVNERA